MSVDEWVTFGLAVWIVVSVIAGFLLAPWIARLLRRNSGR